jgi:predicted metal-binding membrane protein
MNTEMNRQLRDFGVRDRLGVIVGLGAVIGLAWGYLLYMGWGMEHMDVGVNMALMPRMMHWQGIDLLLVFLMWAIMMLAMMLPSAAPMILVFAALDRQHREGALHFQRVCAFVAGYAVVWTGFSVFATVVQWSLLEARLISPMMRSSSPALGAAVLVAAGAFQFTRFKQGCLVACRSPLAFLAAHWRSALTGAFAMGLKHGAYCLGCCWLLMALLFVLGVMNVLWIAALAAFVLFEKTFPRIGWVGRVSGAALIAWGMVVLWPG